MRTFIKNCVNFLWTSEIEAEIWVFQDIIQEKLVLLPYNPNLQLTLYVNAFFVTDFSFNRSQRIDGETCIIKFESTALKNEQMKYSVYELEPLELCREASKCTYYVRSAKQTIVLWDHLALKIFENKELKNIYKNQDIQFYI